MTKSGVSCGFGHISEEILNGKLYVLCSDVFAFLQGASENLHIISQLLFTCFKSIDSNTKEMCEICPMLTLKTPKQRRCRRSGVSIVNFECISQLFSLFLSPTLSK